MKRLLPLLIALFPAVVNAQAFRVGSGIQIVPRATAPAKVAANGSVWLKLSDSTLHYVNPAGTDIALGAGGGGSISLTCTGPLTCTPSTITGTGSVALGTTGPGAVTTGGSGAYIASVTTDAYGRVASMTTGTPPGATAITTGRVAYGTGTSITGSPDFTFDGVKVSTLNLWSSFLTMTPQTLASCTYGSSTAGCLAYDTATSLLKYSNNNGISWTALGGGSGTVTSITAGTGLSGGAITTSGTIAIDSTVATLTGTQTLTNKSLSAPSMSTVTIVGTAQFNSSASGAIAGAIRYNGTNLQYSDASTWTNFAAGGGSTGNYTFTGNTMDLTASATMQIGGTNSPTVNVKGIGFDSSNGINGISTTVALTLAGNYSGTTSGTGLIFALPNNPTTNRLQRAFRWTQGGFDVLSYASDIFNQASLIFYDGQNGSVLTQINTLPGQFNMLNAVGNGATIVGGDYSPRNDVTYALGGSASRFTQTWSKVYATTVGTAISSTGSGVTIAPTNSITHITGTGSVANITVPVTGFLGCIDLVPDAAFTTTTAGNIALASTAVVNKTLRECFDGTKWTPSY